LREAHGVLGAIAGTVEYNWKAAERYFQAAMADPVPPMVRFRFAFYFLMPLRRFEEAITQYQQALETDPLAMSMYYGLSVCRYYQGRYDEAIECAANAVELFPDYWAGHLALGMALAQKGCIQDSIASLETAVRLWPAFTLASGFQAASYWRTGDHSKAEEIMEQIRERSARCSPFCFAVYYAARGERDKMFDCLGAALADRDFNLLFMDAEPYFQPFRSDPRYQALMKQMNLA